MGCYASKPDRQKEEMLPKLPPRFSRMLGEIKRRRSGATLSKKELLEDGYEDESGSGTHHNDRKSSVSSPEPDDDRIGSAKVAPEPTEPQDIFADKEVIAQEKVKDNAEDHKKDKKEDEDEEKVIEVVASTIEKLALEEKEDNHEDEEYGRFSSVEEPLTCPSSPSFRFFLIDSVLPDHKDVDDRRKDDYMSKRSLSDTEVDTSEIVESQTSTEESATKIKKRGRKGMRFRRVIPKGKSFLKVKSCYYPSCGGQEMFRRLAAEKSATG